MKQLKEAARLIIQTLKFDGFTIQRYDSKSTNSIYLKLDYGVAYSVRISDHKGKRHLSYRFNVLPEIEAREDGQGRLYYTFDELTELVADITRHKEARLRQYGRRGYETMMERNRSNNAEKKGFWKQAKLV